MNFSDLKKQSSLGTLTQKLVQEVEKMGSNSSGKDERYWSLSCDKAGNGMAVIRFLPPPPNEDMPFVRLYSHAFQGPGGWYIENSLTTLGQKDPCGDLNSLLWNNGTDAGKEQARKQRRKLTYVSNIYVVKDPANPENEGKNYLFRYGKKIFDKIMEASKPEYEDEVAIEAFDFWKGANFKLKAKNVAGYRNYDSSEFGPVSTFRPDGDASVSDEMNDLALEQVWKKAYSLQELVSPDKFKSYDELKKRLDAVLGNSTSSRQNSSSFDDDEDDSYYGQPSSSSSSFKEEVSFNSKSSANEDEDDDTLAYFQRLAME